MDATAKLILDNLKAKKYEPVYLLQGEEPYYIDVISSYIEANVLNESEKSFNQVVLYGKDAPINVILTHAKRFPMMAERQVVIVREAQEIPDLQKEAGAKLLLDYITKPVLSTVLVLCHKHKPVDKRKELGKKLDKLPGAATFKKIYDNQLPDFIFSYVKDKGHKMDVDAVQVLAECVGTDLSRVANEIDKILISTEKGEAITSGKVMAQVGISREYNIFELQKALIQKDALKLDKMVYYFEGNVKKNPVIPIVAFLFSFFSKVLAAHGALDKSERGLVNTLKINPFAAKDYSYALQRFSLQQVIRNISLLKNADLKLKGVNSGSENESEILKELIFQLIV
ncbi:MAG: DNA polymerase III subunit delta [Cytophagales bacterium]